MASKSKKDRDDAPRKKKRPETQEEADELIEFLERNSIRIRE